jgi:carbonic anhydrase
MAMQKVWCSGLLTLVASFVIAVAVTPAIPQSATQYESSRETGSQSVDQIWNTLMDGNKRFVAGKAAAHDVISQRRNLAKTQNPLVAVLSCSDSRVPPETIFDQGLGDLFVVRAAGNSADPMGIGSLEYAVEHLGTVVIVVLGHQSCGAVIAACSGEKMPTSNLQSVVEPIAVSCRLAKERHASEDLVDFAIKDHIRETANTLLSHSEVLKHAHDAGKLNIVEAYYSLDSGTVTHLR